MGPGWRLSRSTAASVDAPPRRGWTSSWSSIAGWAWSRYYDAGADPPPPALTIKQVVDDLVAVLDDAHVEKAVLYGTSYGTYIAAGVGVRHPQRVRE